MASRTKTSAKLEQLMAERIKAEREKREWSYRELSRNLAALPDATRLEIDPSALHKIEQPSPDGRRRRITVDEAVSFAAIFDVPLSEWLLSPDDRAHAEGWLAFTEARELLNDKRRVVGDYNDRIARVRANLPESDSLRAQISGVLYGSVQQMRDKLAAQLATTVNERTGKLYEVDAALVWANPTPQMIAARDALAERWDFLEHGDDWIPSEGDQNG